MAPGNNPAARSFDELPDSSPKFIGFIGSTLGRRIFMERKVKPLILPPPLVCSCQVQPALMTTSKKDSRRRVPSTCALFSTALKSQFEVVTDHIPAASRSLFSPGGQVVVYR